MQVMFTTENQEYKQISAHMSLFYRQQSTTV
jgi:hypothetical protein